MYQDLGSITAASLEEFALGIVNAITGENTFFRATWANHDAYSGIYNHEKIIFQSSVQQYFGVYSNGAVTISTVAKLSGVVTKSTLLKSLDARSSRSSGWVLRFTGVDANDKNVEVGFDATGGIYCYYDGTLLWNIRP